jgi:polyphenol oxidase
MWQLGSGVIQENKFPFFHLMTTSLLGDIKEPAAWQDLCDKYSIDRNKAVTAEQVHGKEIAVVDDRSGGERVKGVDGLITGEKDLPLAVFTADCLPVFFGAKNKTAVGIVHAGWRGIAAGIIPGALNIFKEKFGIAPNELIVAIGPHIQRCCYTIGKEIKDAFNLSYKEAKFDLAGEVARQLAERGANSVIHNFQCTAHESGLFFSYRRDKTKKRMLSMIKL